MASRYDLIADVSPVKEMWKVKVRIVALWNLPNSGSGQYQNSIEMMLCDEKNGRIHATIKRQLVSKFGMLVKQGRVFVVTNFGVGQNSGQFRVTDHSYKINFHFSTSLREVDEANISLYGFNFVSYADILSGRAEESCLVDIIGELTAIGNVQQCHVNGTETKRLNIELSDIENTCISCTLWGDFAEKVSSIAKVEVDMPIVIVLQLAKIKKWKGTISLSNTKFCTRLFVNEDILEIVQFKDRLTSREAPSQKLSQLSSDNAPSAEDDFLKLSVRKTMDDLREIKEDFTCVVLGSVLCIETEYNWFYNSCKKCRKKVKIDGGKHWCDNCCEYARYVLPRFKIQLRVMDETGSASFVIFDREAMQILKNSASDFRSHLVKNGDSDSFPDELNQFVGKRFIFKIKVKEGYDSYAVIRMSDDKGLIDTFEKQFVVNQESTINFLGSCELEIDNEKMSHSGTFTNYEGTSDDIIATPLAKKAKTSGNEIVEDCLTSQMSSSKVVLSTDEKLGGTIASLPNLDDV